ncbi:MAG: response regulator [Cyanobacteria bacterium P01_H01_bin.121]
MEYQAGQLLDILSKMQQRQTVGVIAMQLYSVTPMQHRPQLLALAKGGVAYTGAVLPKPAEFAMHLGKRLKSRQINAGVNFATEKLGPATSIWQFLDFLVSLNVLAWDKIEAAVLQDVVCTLEHLMQYPGRLKFDDVTPFELTFGPDQHLLDWQQIQLLLGQRRQQWARLQPDIPSLGAIPHKVTNTIDQIDSAAVKKHLHVWVDGQRDLVSIARAFNKDTLELARVYHAWLRQGWLRFQEPVSKSVVHPTRRAAVASLARPPEPSDLGGKPATILSFDDSPIVQAKLKRFLSRHYKVILTNNARDAFKILMHHPISLLLLDVTMPEVDGLEFCRTIRNVPRFQSLPVVMLTAKDTAIDKLKGKIAGSTSYLTKSVSPKALLDVIERYLSVQA